MKKFKILLTLFLATYIAYGQDPDIDILEIASGFNRPVDIQNAGDDRLFIVEQSGSIRIINDDNTVNSTPFISIAVNDNGNEQGLLGLTFHPDYATNGFFYVHYTRSNGDSQISRYTVTGDPDIADPNSEFPILQVDQPFGNHNGGGLAFGNDGFLYIGLGDGGSGGDPGNRAQNPSILLGKMLRIDVDNQDNGLNYSIPDTNPFVGQTSFRGEIWDYGLRNPFRFSFDDETGAMWIGDVGQNAVEEIDRGTGGGHNYGWRCYEGSSTFNTSGCPDPSELTFPVAEYTHDNSCGFFSVVGGYVYRGADFPTMQGLYFFSDTCADDIRYVDATTPAAITFSESFNGNSFVTFGEDQNKELYISGLAGTVYRVVDANLLSTDEFTQENNIRVYPNPASQTVNIAFSNVPSTDTVSIFDITGKLVKSAPIQTLETTINIGDLTAGVYLLQLKNTRYTQKLIIK
ncbi:PQQ-dependent sugar dehydrogenase [uncultured Dokdonia sp.]|uniref:PQQ-dependent sugar dehydrogenase n=1 Tax=uncultured Dokdonia sp. TaxID=575653 RepID=UPI0026357F16|nr:PQQ-dependent sugar dehydrogenase [uncultured Dokdonia sp.]